MFCDSASLGGAGTGFGVEAICEAGQSASRSLFSTGPRGVSITVISTNLNPAITLDVMYDRPSSWSAAKLASTISDTITVGHKAMRTNGDQTMTDSTVISWRGLAEYAMGNAAAIFEYIKVIKSRQYSEAGSKSCNIRRADRGATYAYRADHLHPR